MFRYIPCIILLFGFALSQSSAPNVEWLDQGVNSGNPQKIRVDCPVVVNFSARGWRVNIFNKTSISNFRSDQFTYDDEWFYELNVSDNSEIEVVIEFIDRGNTYWSPTATIRG